MWVVEKLKNKREKEVKDKKRGGVKKENILKNSNYKKKSEGLRVGEGETEEKREKEAEDKKKGEKYNMEKEELRERKRGNASGGNRNRAEMMKWREKLYMLLILAFVVICRAFIGWKGRGKERNY